MSEPFLSLAKAYYRYSDAHRPSGDNKLLAALKCIEAALMACTGGACPKDIDQRVLDEAASTASNHYKMPYGVGRNISIFARFISEKGLVAKQLQWKNPFQRPVSNVRTGRAAAEHRSKRLPSDAALDAIAEIFFRASVSPRDIVTTSFAAIALSVPSRGSEILELPIDCEVEEKTGDAKTAYGLRFWPKKGAPPQVKWVPDPMVPIVKSAIERVRSLTLEARSQAGWLEENPTELYPFPEIASYSPFQPIPRSHIKNTFGQGVLKRIENYIARHGLPKLINKSIINSAIRDHLSPAFPKPHFDSSLKFSQSLFCMTNSALRNPVNPGLLPWLPDINIVLKHLSRNSNIPSIFSDHGFSQPDGSPLSITTHQFRHHLNTLAQRGGMSQQEIARWSGRADVKQNRAYDHMDEFELLGMLREHSPALQLGTSLEAVAEQLATKLPMTRQEFNQLQIPTAHITELGFCIHDFVMSPCQRFRDCINCTEQVCIKGDRRTSLLKERQALVQAQIVNARSANEEGYYGSDRWIEIHELTERRLGNLIDIMEDPTIPCGSIIRLSNDREFNKSKMAIRGARARGVLSLQFLGDDE